MHRFSWHARPLFGESRSWPIPDLSTLSLASATPETPTNVVPGPQSVAALLPEDRRSILAHFGFDYSPDSTTRDRRERYSDLNNMSVVAEGWTQPARRLLFRTVGQDSGMVASAGGGDGGYGGEVAGAVFKLLKQLPNLRQLRLFALPFDSFNSVDSVSMHAAVLLPHLHDLDISGIPFPHSLIFDLLTTSDHLIDRLSVYTTSDSPAPPVPPAPPATFRQLDFRGKLRFLSTGADFYRTLVDHRWINHEGLEGLEELQLRGINVRSRAGGEDLYRVIAPTLRTLTIDSDELTWFAHFLPLFTDLSRLSISGFRSAGFPDPSPLLRCLPPSLLLLQLDTDSGLSPTLTRWTAHPSLVPAGLKQIHIRFIYDFETYQRLPSISTLGTTDHPAMIDHLERLSPNILPFKTIEMWFQDARSNRRGVVATECQRLGVTFRQRLWY